MSRRRSYAAKSHSCWGGALLTGDPIYAAWAGYHVLTFFPDLARRAQYRPPRFTHVNFGSYIPLLMSTVARAMDRDPDGFA